jgi:hypothetical protein
LPQQYSEASSRIAQVWVGPVSTEVAVRPLGRLTATGVLLFVVLPMPRAPPPLYPQQYSEASSSTAQVCLSPRDTEVAVRPLGRLTATGVLLFVVVPSPSWP